ncbi:MAG: hypothetical protein JZU67_07195, partial [Burkholderiaceae bacterium]|nr:hypothetical protein [Burkholderiaceae bacterium]
ATVPTTPTSRPVVIGLQRSKINFLRVWLNDSVLALLLIGSELTPFFITKIASAKRTAIVRTSEPEYPM